MIFQDIYRPISQREILEYNRKSKKKLNVALILQGSSYVLPNFLHWDYLFEFLGYQPLYIKRLLLEYEDI